VPPRVPVGRERPAEAEALGDVAPQQRQAGERLVVLDALGHDLQPEAAPEVDRRAHDRRVAGIVSHAHDERAVDLDLVERQAPQIGQGGLALAEVVE